MFDKIIKEICVELDIKYNYLSKDWIIRLEKDGIVRFLAGNKFDLNPHALGLVMDDKYAFYDIVSNLGIPACEHRIFYRPGNGCEYAKGCNSYLDIYRCFDEYKKDVVVKINNGSLGIDVYHVKDKERLKEIVDKLFIKNYSISICPYYKIKNEYRVIVLDKEIKLIYKKIRPVVYGDGVSSINTLLRRFNSYYFKDKNVSEEILDKEIEYVYDWHFNLSKGSIASMDIDKVLRKRLEDIARETASKMGIVFASIDIIEEDNGELRVLEANSGVTIDKAINFIDNGYEVAKNIYKDATKMMFNI